MAHEPGQPATWIDEDVTPIPKNIYGATKLAAEHLCREVARNDGLPVVILRTSRFFPEDDDSAAARASFAQDNLQALELLYRRADIADMASAHLLAIERAAEAGVGPFIVSATTPVHRGRPACARAATRARSSARSIPESEALFAARGWRFFEAIDRVYSNRRAREALGWRPRVRLPPRARLPRRRARLPQRAGAGGRIERLPRRGLRRRALPRLTGSAFDRDGALSAAWKPILLCCPSQNGLVVDPPQRHRKIRCLPSRS